MQIPAVLLLLSLTPSLQQIYFPGELPPTLAQNECSGEGDIMTRSGPDLAKSANSIGLLWFDKLAAGSYNDKNMVISTYSIWRVLSLAYLGAEGQTKREFEVLGLRSRNDVIDGQKELENSLKSSNGPTFDAINNAYFDNQLTLHECVRDIPNIKIVDFQNSQITANLINEDISDATRENIKDMLSASDIQNAKLVLLNAIYFKGNWKNPFDPFLTQKMQFKNERGHDLGIVDMMYTKAEFKYGKIEEVTVLELPYENSDISMRVILPDSASSVNEALANINNILNHELGVEEVNVFLPKFNMKTKLEDDLKQVLKMFWIRDLFDANRANLNKFSSQKLFASSVIHQATIEVTEEGTVATAATALFGNRIVDNSAYFVANRPFIYVIKDNKSGLILFTGVYRTPEKS